MPTSPAPVLLRPRALVAAGVALLATLGIAAVSAAATVEVAVDGDLHDVRTYGATVDDVLDELDLAIDPADAVTPGPDTPVEDGLRVEVVRAITVEVEVHNDADLTVTAPVTSVADVLEEADMADVRDEGARIVPAWSAPVRDGDTISVQLPVDVTVEADGEQHETSTLATNVEDVLAETGVRVGPEDIVVPGEGRALVGPTTITVRRVETAEETEEVALDHGEQRRETDELERGTTRVEREGEDGLRIDTYEVTLIDGEETDRERIDQEIAREPTDRIVLVGTKAPPPPPAPATSSSSGSGVWDRLARCESGGRWNLNTGNGYYGGLQFHPQTWRAVGGSGLPHQASKAEQIKRGQILQQRSGWGQWPACSRKLGLS